MPPYRSLHPQVVVELRRARRYEHPLGVVMLSLLAPTLAWKERNNGYAPASGLQITPAVYGLLGAFLRNTVRETDIVTGMPESLAYAAFLPGVDRCGAQQALARFNDGFYECAGFGLRGGVSAFPVDGLTIEDVLEQARAAWLQACRRDIATSVEPRYSHG